MVSRNEQITREYDDGKRSIKDLVSEIGRIIDTPDSTIKAYIVAKRQGYDSWGHYLRAKKSTRKETLSTLEIEETQ